MLHALKKKNHGQSGGGTGPKKKKKKSAAAEARRRAKRYRMRHGNEDDRDIEIKLAINKQLIEADRPHVDKAVMRRFKKQKASRIKAALVIILLANF